MNNVIIACDFSTNEELHSFIKKILPHKPVLKIGLELYCALGNQVVLDLKKQGYKIFLDLKLHDIPNTVAKTIKVLDKLDVDFLTIHSLGGLDMMKAARKATKKIKLLAVTILTSISGNILFDQLFISEPIDKTIMSLALNAYVSKLDGVICSVHESKLIKNVTNNKLLTVCPGIRLDGQDTNDQSRIATPQFAKINNVDYIVVGRAITASENPKEMYEKVNKLFTKGE